jgi:D-glycero-alpha-D-manno-heptose-7-phosphate kinase
MVVSQTPLRLSFVGGGTDFASYYQTNKGQVISATIDKYIYVIVKKGLMI